MTRKLTIVEKIDGAFSDLLNAVDEAKDKMVFDSPQYEYLDTLETQVEDLYRRFQGETAETERQMGKQAQPYYDKLAEVRDQIREFTRYPPHLRTWQEEAELRMLYRMHEYLLKHHDALVRFDVAA